MVIDQVHVRCYAVHEAEDDAPVPGYAHAPLVAPVASQRVQPVAGNVHVPRPQRNVQVRQDAPNTWSQGRGDSACITPPEECPQSLVLDNYTSIVTRYMPCCNLSERVIRLVRCGRVERCGSPLAEVKASLYRQLGVGMVTMIAVLNTMFLSCRTHLLIYLTTYSIRYVFT